MREQSATPHGTDSFDILESACLPSLAALGAHTRDGKAVRFVSDHRNEHQCGACRSEHQRFSAVGKDERFQARLAPLTFGHADDHGNIKSEFVKDVLGHMHLAAPAVNEHERRKLGFAAGHGRIACRMAA